jgi:hypothetical protein
VSRVCWRPLTLSVDGGGGEGSRRLKNTNCRQQLLLGSHCMFGMFVGGFSLIPGTLTDERIILPPVSCTAREKLFTKDRNEGAGIRQLSCREQPN